MPVIAQIIIVGFSLVGISMGAVFAIGMWGSWQNPYGL